MLEFGQVNQPQPLSVADNNSEKSVSSRFFTKNFFFIIENVVMFCYCRLFALELIPAIKRTKGAFSLAAKVRMRVRFLFLNKVFSSVSLFGGEEGEKVVGNFSSSCIRRCNSSCSL